MSYSNVCLIVSRVCRLFSYMFFFARERTYNHLKKVACEGGWFCGVGFLSQIQCRDLINLMCNFSLLILDDLMGNEEKQPVVFVLK